MPTAHFIEGEAGCKFARRHGCTAVVVDALRASATAAALLHAGARRLLITSKVSDALAAREEWQGALLYGERGGLPPRGFDYGNSPAEAVHAAGRDVIFTTTTGAGRVVQCWGAPCVLMGSTVNAGAVAAAMAAERRHVVFIPAGLMHDPAFDAQEDRVAAAYLAMRLGWPLGEGESDCRKWQQRIELERMPALFDAAPHAASLRALGLANDIPLCAAIDTLPAVPQARQRTPHGVLCSSYS